MDDTLAAIVYRGHVPESHHRARVAITAPDGTLRLGLGDLQRPTLPRSALKPFQVIAMLESGLDLADELLALAGASHRGEPFHLDGARRILAGVSLTETDLVNTADIPYDDDARLAWLRAGRGREPIAHNCSGKHAAMLRTCVRAGWPLEGYRDPAHPLQRAIRRVIEDWCGVVGEPVVDGCSAPAFATTLPGLARGFGRLAVADAGPAEAVASSYRRFGAWMSGTQDPTVGLLAGVPGCVAKGGAEAVLAVGLPDGTGVALKMSDGMGRGRFAVLRAVLQALGHDWDGDEAGVVVAPELEQRLAVLRDD